MNILKLKPTTQKPECNKKITEQNDPCDPAVTLVICVEVVYSRYTIYNLIKGVFKGNNSIDNNNNNYNNNER